MELSAKLVRSQLNFFKPFVAGCSLEVTRKGQDKLGELMSAIHKREVLIRDHDFERFQGAWVMPKDERRSGVVLYLHGGGYTCGSLDYAKGFAATLASECGVRVFCAAYRLAPENPYPAAVEDALTAFDYLLKKGYAPHQILLCGESAGGGLIYALCLKLKQLGRELPCGLIGISPWVDLTGSGASYETNRDNDPSLTQELLEFYAKCYTQDPTDPLCSPVRGDLKHLTPDELRPVALSYLKPKRMPHVLGTEQEAVRLAERYGADVTKARVAALLHDCTKKLDMAEQLALCERYHIPLDELERKALKLLHSKTGAAIARDVFAVDDEVYNAILYHTTGKPDMTLLEKIIYLADYIEPTRDFPGVEELRRTVYEDLDRGLLLGLTMTIQEMEELGNPVHYMTRDARDYLMKRGIS